MKDSILLSIIIPTYKRSNNICRAIDSILKQKGSYEIIVVDDNGAGTVYQKETQKKLDKYFKLSNFSYIIHEINKNGAAARNTGINFSKGEYVTFLDDDDEFGEDRINSFEDLVLNKKADYIFSGYIIKKNLKIEKKDIPVIKSNKEMQYDLLSQKSYFGTGSNIIVRKELIDIIKGFDEKFIRHQDMEFVIRILEISNKIEVLKNFSIIKNIDDNQNVPEYEKLLEVKKQYLRKFEYIISKYDLLKQRKIYKLNYLELVRNSLIINNKSDYKKAIALLKEENLYKLIDIISIKLRLQLKSIKIFVYLRNKYIKLKNHN